MDYSVELRFSQWMCLRKSTGFNKYPLAAITMFFLISKGRFGHGDAITKVNTQLSFSLFSDRNSLTFVVVITYPTSPRLAWIESLWDLRLPNKVNLWKKWVLQNWSQRRWKLRSHKGRQTFSLANERTSRGMCQLSSWNYPPEGAH